MMTAVSLKSAAWEQVKLDAVVREAATVDVAVARRRGRSVLQVASATLRNASTGKTEQCGIFHVKLLITNY